MRLSPANPLRQPKVPRDQRLLKGRFYFADGDGKIGNQVASTFLLGPDYLWLTSDLSIPLDLIRSVAIVDCGGFPKRRVLRIVYENPITRRPEAVSLVRSNFFMLPSLRLLKELQDQLEQARAKGGASSSAKLRPVADANQPLVCEVCGATPAYYVGYTHLVSALVLWYRAAISRRTHCRRHNLRHGLLRYLLTASTGWFGIGIFVYPVLTYRTARSMAPSLGRATYVLGILPSAVLAGIVAWLVLGA